MTKIKDINDLPYPEAEVKHIFKYNEALTLLEQGKKVCNFRWLRNNTSNLYVELLEHKYYVKEKGYKSRKELILFDKSRQTMVNFVPSVENQFEDDWFEVDDNDER